MSKDIFISCGGAELLDEVRGLWEQLNAHHATHSPHFAEMYERKTFTERKQALLDQGSQGLFVALALDENGMAVGYCVGTVSSESVGEVDSLFVAPLYRAQDWLTL